MSAFFIKFLRNPLFARPFSGKEILPRSDEMLKRRDFLSPLSALPFSGI
ncbi:hypothetical protein PRIPAC_70275, partial [Pristionchus pacificus]